MVRMIEDHGNMALSNPQEEKVFVSIRVRPLNVRERTRHDVSDWECVSSNTIRLKNNGHAEQRSMDTYTFDRVFGEKCSTKQVYEQGIKEVALSVVRGINCSIFAYGQTSSGKTYTMTGITEYTVRNIYEYIEKHKDREFVVKFSAMEIYNEAVRDLLNATTSSLRLRDDPEKGTVVDKLTEETLTERSQLQQLLSTCAAERTTEETAMNETSSRSHLIVRLTVESNPCELVDTETSGALAASVNFVDLAGSERAAQAMSAGTRLREGSHINRSLLALGTVIRKLSKGRNEHIPYRDSKLTRILQNSLGGNARTAIICTISPARSQVEQSRNTLHFAGCAKQVTTNARVNLLISDKILVKQLQKELARLKNELKSLSPNTILLKEKENQIEQMDKEIKELTRQLQSHVENLIQPSGNDKLVRLDKDSASESSGAANNLLPRTESTTEKLGRTRSRVSSLSNELLQQTENSEDDFLLDGNSPTFVGPDPCQGWEEIASKAEPEDSCKEVPCIEIKEVETESVDNSQDAQQQPLVLAAMSPQVDKVGQETSMHGDFSKLDHEPTSPAQFDVQVIETTLPPPLDEPEQVLLTLPADVERENSPSLFCFEDMLTEQKLHATKRESSRKSSATNLMGDSVEDLESGWDSDTEDTASVLNFVVKMSEKAKLMPLNKDIDDVVVCATSPVFNKRGNKVKGFSFHGISGALVSYNFERQQREIIELWDACNVPLVHRTYFFLLIKGELSDSVYLDIELRRLSFLKATFASGSYITQDSPDVTPNSSMISLNRERKMLSKQVPKKFSRKEREELYQKWGIDLKSKHRSVQLAWLVWTNTKDLNHARESAALVAMLVGFINSGEGPKKTFGLGFFTRRKSSKQIP